MKKITVAVLAAAMLCTMSCTVSCGGKKPENAISEPIPESSEKVFREIFPEDIREIKVNFDYLGSEAPIPHYEREMNIRIEPEISPCKAYHTVDEEITVPQSYYDAVMDEDARRELIELYIGEEEERIIREKHKLKTPYGCLNNWMIYGGGYVFAQAEYDELCSHGSHAFDILRIDAETNECTTVFSHRSKDDAIDLAYMKYIDGSLFIDTRGSDGNENGDDGNHVHHIYRLDDEKGELEEIDTAALNDMMHTWALDNELEDRLTVKGYTGTGDDFGLALAEYDFKTGKWSILTETDGDTYSKGEAVLYNDKFMKSGKDADGTLCITAEGDFTLHTGLRGAFLKTARDDMLAAAVSDALGNAYLYVYDLSKLERYDYDLTGMSIYPDTAAFLNGNAMYLAKSHGAVLLLPAIGAAFKEYFPNTYYSCGGKQYIFRTNYIDEDDLDRPTNVTVYLTIIG